ncbi:MAG: 2TM domain-containing protein [Methanomicrobiales archaeon]|nr:2TM domain-containing protein [Methanomicrobiales archaeon]
MTVRPDEPIQGGKDGRGRDILTDLPMRGLVYHAVLYLGIMLILFAVNLKIAPETLWVVWIAVLWGILLIWNAWQVFRPTSRI